MITKELIRKGIERHLVTFEVDPNMSSGTGCRIGDGWFYFGGQEAEEASPEEYVKNVPMDDIVSEIFDVLNDFRNIDEFKDEYDYYEYILTPTT